MNKQQLSISRKNNKKAKEHFNLQKGWVLHHNNPDWKYNDVERYIQWNPEDLTPMINGEHTRLHMQLDAERVERFRQYAKQPKSEEAKQHMSEAQKELFASGKRSNAGENNSMYGKCHSEETKKMMSEQRKGRPATIGSTGMHWYNNGIDNKMAYECPEGYTKGKIGGNNPYRDSKGRFTHANTEVSSGITKGPETPLSVESE